MKRVAGIILLIAIILPLSVKVMIVGDFVLNQAQITEELCVNKDKPSLECNGKCALMQQLMADEPKEQNNSAPIPLEVLKLKLSEFVKNQCQLDLSKLSSQYSSPLVLRKQIRNSNEAILDIFRPPRF